MNEYIKAFDDEGTLPFDFPTESRKIIKVIGVGGGGGNAVANMYREGIKDVVFVVANTDQQALVSSQIPIKLQLGRQTTKGLGAGNDPEVARQAAEESIEDIQAQFKDETQMVFITAGMGGGTGTGAAPVIARIAREMGVLTVGIVTIPFKFEMHRKITQALNGVRELSKYVDALLVISNEKLVELCPGQSVTDGFKLADRTLTTATKSIAELITCRGLINLDFRDVRKILSNGGIAIMSEGFAQGDNRVAKAFESALHSPLLYNNDIHKSSKILFNIYQGNDAVQQLQIDEINEIRHFMEKFNDKNIEVIWGLAQDDNLKSGIRISVLATGFGMDSIPDMENPDMAIDQVYGNGNSKYVYVFQLDDSDLDNESLIDAMASKPVYTRSANDVNELRKLRIAR